MFEVELEKWIGGLILTSFGAICTGLFAAGKLIWHLSKIDSKIEGAIGTGAQFSTVGIPFVATTNTVSFNWSETGAATLFSGGAANTCVTLTELNNEVEGNF